MIYFQSEAKLFSDEMDDVDIDNSLSLVQDILRKKIIVRGIK